MAVSSAFIVCSTSAMVLVMSTGHRSRVSPSRWITKPLTVLDANDDLSPVEYGAINQPSVGETPTKGGINGRRPSRLFYRRGSL